MATEQTQTEENKPLPAESSGSPVADEPEFSPPAPAAVPSQQQQANVEKRQSARHNVRWRALLLASPARIPVLVVDISDGGISFLCNRALASNTCVEAAIFIPDAKKPGTYLVTNVTIQILYHVLSRQDFRFGAKFQTPSVEFLDRMHQAIQRGLS